MSSFLTNLGDKLESIRTFLWNKQEKTVLGRGGRSWGNRS